MTNRINELAPDLAEAVTALINRLASHPTARPDVVADLGELSSRIANKDRTNPVTIHLTSHSLASWESSKCCLECSEDVDVLRRGFNHALNSPFVVYQCVRSFCRTSYTHITNRQLTYESTSADNIRGALHDGTKTDGVIYVAGRPVSDPSLVFEPHI